MKYYCFLFLLTFVLISCSKDTLLTTCVKDFFKENNIVESDGTDLGCEIYIELWTKNEIKILQSHTNVALETRGQFFRE